MGGQQVGQEREVILLLEHFDVPAYTRSTFGPMRDRLQGSSLDLTAAARAALTALGRTMQATSGWLAHVLVTHTHKEARVTAFLTAWAYERHWLGDGLLALGGDAPGLEVEAEGHPLRGRVRQLGPLRAAIVANLHGRALLGAQMVERLVDCWVLDAQLAQIQRGAPDGVAQDIAEIRIALVRQARFFDSEAQRELAASKATRRLARRTLLSHAWPLGADASAIESAALLAAGGWQEEVLAQVRELPGLKKVRLPGLPWAKSASPGSHAVGNRPAAGVS